MAFIVCAMLLLTIGYFATLVTGEIALWLYNRLPETNRPTLVPITIRRPIR